MKANLIELTRLERYLKDHGYKYERKDEEVNEFMNRHQIVVMNDKGEYMWDAICHFGSYGYEQGLLEIAGDIVTGDYAVEGFLTAKDVIDRLKGVA